MESIKYLLFYALLIVVGVLSVLNYHWLVIIPAALVLTIAYIAVKGNTWRQVMGKGDMNGAVVFIATFISQIVLAGILYGIGRAIQYFLA